MSLDNNQLELNVAPNGQNGTFASSGNITVNVAVDGTGGFTLGIQSSSNNTDLVNQTDNTKKFTSITSNVSASDFSANTSIAGTNYNGKWGYLPSKYDSLENTTYHPAPDNTGDVLDATYGRNEQGQYTISIGARAGMDNMAGVYSNTFIITTVSNYLCSVGEICYDDNGGTDGLMDNQAIPSGNTEIGLAGNNYRRSGYGFAGWSTTALDPDDPDFASNFASTTVYGPMENIAVPSAGYAELYAVWVPSEGNMQAWNGCSSMNIGDVTALTDTRDGNVYAVAKLADGECWQIENMRLDFSDENTELTNLNTNHATATFMADANSHPAQVAVYGSDRYSTKIEYDKDSLIGNYIRGVSYNWMTMRAGNGNVNGTNSNNGDICPAGWRVPTDPHYSNYLIAISGGSTAWKFDETTTPTGRTMYNTFKAFPNNFVTTFYATDKQNVTYSFLYPENLVTNRFDNRGAGFNGIGAYTASGEGGFTLANAAWSNVYSYNGSSFRCVMGQSASYTLSYHANGGTNVPASETITSTSGIFEDITTAEPTRSGYTFIGWVDKDGIEVQPGGGYNAGVGNTNATLYAIWANDSCNPSATTIGTGNATDAVCMQDMNGAVKNAMSDANAAAGSIQTFQLIDARDNKSYDIALLDDGNVWMTKNLYLGEDRSIALSHYDTNLPDTQSFVLPAAGTGNHRVASYNGEQYDGYYNGVYYGGYYSWNSATVSDLFHHANTNRSTSICPSGWDLPSSAHYANLASMAGLTNDITASANPYNFTLGGYASFSTGNGILQYTFSGQGTRGDYWTSTGSAYGENYYEYLLYATGYYITSSDFASSNARSKSYGQNVRCIDKNGTATIHYNGNGNATYPVVGSTSTQVVDISTGNASVSGFMRANYIFNSWNTRADGSGTRVNAGSSVYGLGLEDGDEITLYAQWTPRITLVYNDNYSNSTKSLRVTAGTSTTLGSYLYFTTKTGYSIKEWNTEPDGSGTAYAVSSSYAVPADLAEPTTVTLYAQWAKDYVITFVNTITGETQTINIKWGKSGTVAPADTWTYNGYRMIGWDTVTNAGTGGGGTVVYTNNASITPTSDFTVYTVWVPVYYVQYDGNGASNATSMAIVNETEGDEQITLYASNFIRSGYGFVGWSFDPNAANDLSSATVYGPNATISVPALTTPGEIKTLYAVWIPAESGVTMQTFDDTASPYDTAPAGTVLALTDSRDNDTYAVAKLADGKWWMIENMRLGGASSITLDDSTSAIGSGTATLPASTNFFYGNGRQINASNKIEAVSSMEIANSNVYSYGVYYDWRVATNSSASTGTVSTSICPYGWHMPTGLGTGEFGDLSEALGGSRSEMSGSTGASMSATFRAFPNNFMNSGNKAYNATINSRGSAGYYWSSTSYSNEKSYGFMFSNTYIYPGTLKSQDKQYGMAIRCIAN